MSFLTLVQQFAVTLKSEINLELLTLFQFEQLKIKTMPPSRLV
jgi:hypothetical protein